MPGYLQEIFSSVQGEGPYVGCRQIFVRFAGCNWDCAYCDTPDQTNPVSFLLEPTPGQRNFIMLSNPREPEELAGILHQYFDLSRHHSISLTGGEPLVHADYIKALVKLISGTRQGIFLETNGTMPAELAKVINHIAIISMDIKLASATGRATPWDLHREFLKIAARQEVYLKIVVSDATKDEELHQAAKLMAELSPRAELVLQPVTPRSGIVPPSADRILWMQEQALAYVANVRVIPQTHRMMGQL